MTKARELPRLNWVGWMNAMNLIAKNHLED